MGLYIPCSIFHVAGLLYVRPETFGPSLILSLRLKERSTEEAEDTRVNILTQKLSSYLTNCAWYKC